MDDAVSIEDVGGHVVGVEDVGGHVVGGARQRLICLKVGVGVGNMWWRN